MTTQLELIRGKAPKINQNDVNTLIRRLDKFFGGNDNVQWITAKRLSFCFGYSDRQLRAIANASKGAIISSQDGYKLTAEATEEERKHAANWLRHQARQMLARATEIETWKKDQ